MKPDESDPNIFQVRIFNPNCALAQSTNQIY